MIRRHRTATDLPARKLRWLEAIMLSIVLVLLVWAGLAVWRLVESGDRAGAALVQLQAVKAGVQAYYRDRENGADSEDGLYPSGRLIAWRGAVGEDEEGAPPAAPLTNPWNGTTGVTGTGDSFIVAMTGVPSDACRVIAGRFDGDDPNLIHFRIGATRFGESGVQMSDGAAAEACAAAPAQTLRWEFF